MRGRKRFQPRVPRVLEQHLHRFAVVTRSLRAHQRPRLQLQNSRPLDARPEKVIGPLLGPARKPVEAAIGGVLSDSDLTHRRVCLYVRARRGEPDEVEIANGLDQSVNPPSRRQKPAHDGPLVSVPVLIVRIRVDQQEQVPRLGHRDLLSPEPLQPPPQRDVVGDVAVIVGRHQCHGLIDTGIGECERIETLLQRKGLDEVAERVEGHRTVEQADVLDAVAGVQLEMHRRVHHFLRPHHRREPAEEVEQAGARVVGDGSTDRIVELGSRVGADEAVVVRHHLHFVLALGHAALERFDDVRAVLRHDRLQGEVVLDVPRPQHGNAIGIESVEHLDDLPDDPDVLAEAELVGRITAVGMIEVGVESERERYLRVLRVTRHGALLAGHGRVIKGLDKGERLGFPSTGEKNR